MVKKKKVLSQVLLVCVVHYNPHRVWQGGSLYYRCSKQNANGRSLRAFLHCPKASPGLPILVHVCASKGFYKLSLIGKI